MEREAAIVHHRFLMPCERVYDGFLDAGVARTFLFATPGGEMVRAELEPRVGGTYTFVDRRDGVDVMHTGEFLELVRPRKIVFTLLVPAFSSETTEVKLELIWKGAEVCDAMLTHTDVPVEELEKTCEGWKEILKAADVALGGAGGFRVGMFMPPTMGMGPR